MGARAQNRQDRARGLRLSRQFSLGSREVSLVSPVRRGFTLTEMLIVIVVMSLLALFTIPRFEGLYEANRIASARQDITTAIATARAAAIQKGRTSTLTLAANQLSVTVTNAGGTQTTVIPRIPLDTLYGVRVTFSNSPLTFDVRGFVSPTLPSRGIFNLQGLSRSDSVCITVIGQIIPRGCTL
jgi:prepilin-type N-terminal cleavage/methylation domain-containing protein